MGLTYKWVCFGCQIVQACKCSDFIYNLFHFHTWCCLRVVTHIVSIILWLPTLWDIGNHPVSFCLCSTASLISLILVQKLQLVQLDQFYGWFNSLLQFMLDDKSFVWSLRRHYQATWIESTPCQVVRWSFGS